MGKMVQDLLAFAWLNLNSIDTVHVIPSSTISLSFFQHAMKSHRRDRQ